MDETKKRKTKAKTDTDDARVPEPEKTDGETAIGSSPMTQTGHKGCPQMQRPAAGSLTVEEAKHFHEEMDRFIETVLVNGVDYGTIPNCRKPTLFKSGAEKVVHYLGLTARTEIVNRVEEYGMGFFSYEARVILTDCSGTIKGEGIGITNSREGAYAQQSGFSVQNTVLKMAKKRALVDAALHIGSLSARFTQDMEDIVPKTDGKPDRTTQAKTKQEHPASRKQMQYLERLMKDNHVAAEAMSRYTKENWNVEDYRKVSGTQASALISRFEAVEKGA